MPNYFNSRVRFIVTPGPHILFQHRQQDGARQTRIVPFEVSRIDGRPLKVEPGCQRSERGVALVELLERADACDGTCLQQNKTVAVPQPPTNPGGKKRPV